MVRAREGALAHWHTGAGAGTGSDAPLPAVAAPDPGHAHGPRLPGRNPARALLLTVSSSLRFSPSSRPTNHHRSLFAPWCAFFRSLLYCFRRYGLPRHSFRGPARSFILSSRLYAQSFLCPQLSCRGLVCSRPSRRPSFFFSHHKPLLHPASEAFFSLSDIVLDTPRHSPPLPLPTLI